MLHEARHTPAVWRFVSDNFQPSWGVVAPNLHGCASIEEMKSAIEQDMNASFIEPPIFVVATGEAAIPAIGYVAHSALSHTVGGLFLSGPRLFVTNKDVRAARMSALASGVSSRLGVSSRKRLSKRARITDSLREQKCAYLEALKECDARDALAAFKESNVPVRIVAGTKDRAGSAGARELAVLLSRAEFFPIEQAEADWNAYASTHFAANVAEFIFNELDADTKPGQETE